MNKWLLTSLKEKLWCNNIITLSLVIYLGSMFSSCRQAPPPVYERSSGSGNQKFLQLPPTSQDATDTHEEKEEEKEEEEEEEELTEEQQCNIDSTKYWFEWECLVIAEITDSSICNGIEGHYFDEAISECLPIPEDVREACNQKADMFWDITKQGEDKCNQIESIRYESKCDTMDGYVFDTDRFASYQSQNDGTDTHSQEELSESEIMCRSLASLSDSDCKQDWCKKCAWLPPSDSSMRGTCLDLSKLSEQSCKAQKEKNSALEWLPIFQIANGGICLNKNKKSDCEKLNTFVWDDNHDDSKCRPLTGVTDKEECNEINLAIFHNGTCKKLSTFTGEQLYNDFRCKGEDCPPTAPNESYCAQEQDNDHHGWMLLVKRQKSGRDIYHCLQRTESFATDPLEESGLVELVDCDPTEQKQLFTHYIEASSGHSFGAEIGEVQFVLGAKGIGFEEEKFDATDSYRHLHLQQNVRASAKYIVSPSCSNNYALKNKSKRECDLYPDHTYGKCVEPRSRSTLTGCFPVQTLSTTTDYNDCAKTTKGIEKEDGSDVCIDIASLVKKDSTLESKDETYSIVKKDECNNCLKCRWTGSACEPQSLYGRVDPSTNNVHHNFPNGKKPWDLRLYFKVKDDSNLVEFTAQEDSLNNNERKLFDCYANSGLRNSSKIRGNKNLCYKQDNKHVSPVNLIPICKIAYDKDQDQDQSQDQHKGWKLEEQVEEKYVLRSHDCTRAPATLPFPNGFKVELIDEVENCIKDSSGEDCEKYEVTHYNDINKCGTDQTSLTLENDKSMGIKYNDNSLKFFNFLEIGDYSRLIEESNRYSSDDPLVFPYKCLMKTGFAESPSINENENIGCDITTEGYNFIRPYITGKPNP